MITEKTFDAVNTTAAGTSAIVGVRISFIKEAYAGADENLKEKIKKELPELFSPLSTINELGLFFYDQERVHIFENGNHIFLKLPQANTKWSQKAFQWALKFLDREPSYTIFHNGDCKKHAMNKFRLCEYENWLFITNQKGL